MVEGPMVGMAAAYSRVAAGQAAAQLQARLDQPPANAVTAIVSVEQRIAAGVAQVGCSNSCGCATALKLDEDRAWQQMDEVMG
jgi:hypothetical protein